MAERLLYKSAARIVVCNIIPPEAIAHVEINPRLVGSPDPRLRAWSDKDFVIKHAAFFAMASYIGQTMRPQPPSARRGLTLRYTQRNRPYIDEYGVTFGQIGAKGTGISSHGLDHYIKCEQEYSLSESPHPFIAPPDPVGFFGFNHSKQEMEVGELLAERTARSGRVLAILAIDHTRFRKWLDKLHIETNPYPVDVMLQKVEKNDDNAAICVRVMGSDKCEDYIHPPSEGLFTRSKMLIRAAGVLLPELKLRGESSFITRYFINQTYDIASLLEQLARGEFSEDNLANFGWLLSDLNSHNQSVQERLSAEKFDGKMTIYLEPQDCDLTGCWYDYENTVPDRPGYMSCTHYNYPHHNLFTVSKPA